MTATEETEPLISTTPTTSAGKGQRVTYHAISFVSTINKTRPNYIYFANANDDKSNRNRFQSDHLPRIFFELIFYLYISLSHTYTVIFRNISLKGIDTFMSNMASFQSPILARVRLRDQRYNSNKISKFHYKVTILFLYKINLSLSLKKYIIEFLSNQ